MSYGVWHRVPKKSYMTIGQGIIAKWRRDLPWHTWLASLGATPSALTRQSFLRSNPVVHPGIARSIFDDIVLNLQCKSGNPHNAMLIFNDGNSNHIIISFSYMTHHLSPSSHYLHGIKTAKTLSNIASHIISSSHWVPSLQSIACPHIEW